MKKSLTIQMIMSFLIVVAVAMAGFSISIYNINSLAHDVEGVKEIELKKLSIANDISYNSIDKVALVRGYFLTRQEFLLDIYNADKESSDSLKDDLISMASSKDEIRIVNSVHDLDELYNTIVDTRIFPLIRAGENDKVLEIMGSELNDVTNDLVAALKEYKEYSNQMIENSFERAISKSKLTVFISIASAVLSAILGIIIGYVSSKRISKPLKHVTDIAIKVANGDLTVTTHIDRQDEIGILASSFDKMTLDLKKLINQIGINSEQVAASSEELTASASQSALASIQVADSISDVAEGAIEQLKASNNATAVVEEISASIEEISASVQEVAEKSQATSDRAKTGGDSVDKAIKQMSVIEVTVNESSELVTRLGHRSNEIGQIIDTISNIANQTNLLALNAAIEAARAGEQGKGFAVVAEEVRKLAEQSQESAQEISKLVTEIQSDTNNAVVAMKEGTKEVKIGAKVVSEAGVSFEEIANMVEFVSTQISEISIAVDQVASGSEVIVSSVRDIDTLSRKTSEESETVSAATEEQSASMDEIAESSQMLSKLSEELRTSISKFRV